MQFILILQCAESKEGLLLLKTENRIPAKFVKNLGSGLFELRTEWESDIFRVFFIFDKGNIVVLFNGFQKKSQKTPTDEIKRARRLIKEYYGAHQ